MSDDGTLKVIQTPGKANQREKEVKESMSV